MDDTYNLIIETIINKKQEFFNRYGVIPNHVELSAEQEAAITLYNRSSIKNYSSSTHLEAIFGMAVITDNDIKNVRDIKVSHLIKIEDK